MFWISIFPRSSMLRRKDNWITCMTDACLSQLALLCTIIVKESFLCPVTSTSSTRNFIFVCVCVCTVPLAVCFTHVCKELDSRYTAAVLFSHAVVQEWWMQGRWPAGLARGCIHTEVTTSITSSTQTCLKSWLCILLIAWMSPVQLFQGWQIESLN